MKVYNTEDGSTATVASAKELEHLVHSTIAYYESQAKRIKEENKQLHDNAVAIVQKDYEWEIVNLKEQLRLSYGEFASEKELQEYNEFVKEHIHDRATSKINGGKRPYLIPTHVGIGTVLYVKCPICGHQKDITDLEVW